VWVGRVLVLQLFCLQKVELSRSANVRKACRDIGF
jgi:hypothetical protein